MRSGTVYTLSLMAIQLCLLCSPAWSQKTDRSRQISENAKEDQARKQAAKNRAQIDAFWEQRRARGGDSSGGGDVFLCHKKKAARRGEIFLADTYALIRHGLLFWDQGVPTEALLESYLEMLKKNDPALGAEMQSTLESLEFTATDEELPELDDDNLTPPSGCRKAQLAIQHIESRRVLYSREYYGLLTSIEKALFKIHEAHIQMRKRPGEDTTEIRQSVAETASNDRYSDFLLATVYRRKLIPEFWFQSAYLKMASFWMIQMLLEEHRVAFCTYVAETRHFRGKASAVRNGLNDRAIYIQLYQTMDALSGTLDGIGLGPFMNAYDDSYGVVDFGFRLQWLQKNQRKWISVKEVKIDEIQGNIDRIFRCLGKGGFFDRIREIEPAIRADFEQYKVLYEAYQSEAETLPAEPDMKIVLETKTKTE